MPIAFTPKSEKELNALAEPGDYDFEVLKAEDQTSKSGNPMIYLKLGIYNGDAMRWHISDYLVAAMEAKLRHFADTTGLLARYESGQLAAQDCVGRAGRVRLGIEQDKEGKYPDKSVVKDYCVRPAKPLPGPIAPTVPTPPLEESIDVPF
jgi:hypothetical protein